MNPLNTGSPEEIIEQLFASRKPEERCTYLRRDEIGPYCSKELDPKALISDERRDICSIPSLQFWCLDKDACKRCIFYQGERF